MQIRKAERTGAARNWKLEIGRTAKNKIRKEELGEIDKVESGLAEQERKGGNRALETESGLVVRGDKVERY
jgi:hypothetical protein